MAMPRGDSVQKVQDYYHYLQARQLSPHGRTETWHIDWVALRWLWGFVIVLAIILLWWIRDYRSSWVKTGISQLDRFGGYTTEAAGRVPLSFWIFTILVAGFGAEFVIGHLTSGQLF
jgi:hypothetical protein